MTTKTKIVSLNYTKRWVISIDLFLKLFANFFSLKNKLFVISSKRTRAKNITIANFSINSLKNIQIKNSKFNDSIEKIKKKIIVIHVEKMKTYLIEIYSKINNINDDNSNFNLKINVFSRKRKKNHLIIFANF